MDDKEQSAIDALPCPFCGSDSELVVDLFAFRVECLTCGSFGPLASNDEEAARAWNKRAPIEKP